MATPAIAALPARPTGEAPSASQMVGEQPSDTGQQERSRGFVNLVKNVHTQLEDIARQYPAFASFARRAQESIKEGMVRTLSEMQSQPGETASTPNFG